MKKEDIEWLLDMAEGNEFADMNDLERIDELRKKFKKES